MSIDIFEQLESFHKRLFEMEEIDDCMCTKLQSTLKKLTDEVPLLATLASLSRRVQNGAELPIRRINYNIKKLSEDCKPRWDRMMQLSCETLVFFMMAFNGLASLPDEDFSWLMANLQQYVEMRAFPRHWTQREQIRKVVSKTPRKINTRMFLES